MQPPSLTDWRRERTRLANFEHDMQMARAEHRAPVCPDCMKPARFCQHREAWEFLRQARRK